MKAKSKKKKSEEVENFAKNARRERKKQKRSQKDVAIAAEITPTYLNEIENNKRSLTLDVAIKIAKTLKVPIGELLKKLL